MSDRPPLPDRFRGCLLGLAVGDALGSPYETLDPTDIFFRFGPPEVLVTNPTNDPLRYTDDTQMMIGLAESLAGCGRVDPGHLMSRFARHYDPTRGYGKSARALLELARTGGDWTTAADTLIPGGSFGNGGAMRVAPVGLLFHHDLDAVWQQAGASASVTHRHPLGVEGVQVMATAVALDVRADRIDRRPFADELLGRVQTAEFARALRTARQLKRGDSVAGLGNAVVAHESVMTAVACFLATPEHFDLAVGRAIGLGGDTDTLAAMTGALCGAFSGDAAIPAGAVAQLENGEHGRDSIRHLADRLYARFVSR